MPEKTILAHHEAAHAIVAIELGVGILDIGIDLDRFESTGGVGNDGCRLFIADFNEIAPSDVEAEQRRLSGLIDRSGAVLAAGPASDAKLRQEDPWLALHRRPNDLELMKDLLQRAQLAATPQSEEDRLRTQVQLAVEALEDEAVWSAVEAVARAVLDRGLLKGREIEAIASSILEPHRDL